MFKRSAAKLPRPADRNFESSEFLQEPYIPDDDGGNFKVKSHMVGFTFAAVRIIKVTPNPL